MVTNSFKSILLPNLQCGSYLYGFLCRTQGGSVCGMSLLYSYMNHQAKKHTGVTPHAIRVHL